jgi:hypothetical protein
MPRVILVALAFVAYAVLPMSAIAQSGLSGISNSVQTLDINFDAADANHDGLLSKDEAKAGHVPFIVKNFDAIDTQHRGLISKDDVHQFIQRALMRSQPAPASSTKQS